MEPNEEKTPQQARLDALYNRVFAHLVQYEQERRWWKLWLRKIGINDIRMAFWSNTVDHYVHLARYYAKYGAIILIAPFFDLYYWNRDDDF